MDMNFRVRVKISSQVADRLRAKYADAAPAVNDYTISEEKYSQATEQLVQQLIAYDIENLFLESLGLVGIEHLVDGKRPLSIN